MIIRDNDKIINCRNWTDLVRPDKLIVDPKTNDRYGKFICEPLERGYGTTIGNALRRILLSSLQGAAIVAVRIEGVQHEFSIIPGVKEDVTEIVINLKKVRIKMDVEDPQRLELEVHRKGNVTAADIKENQNVHILNPEQKICTLTEDRDLRAEFEVRMGKSYVPAEQLEEFNDQIGQIVLDASFSPIKKVAYSVEQARVGQMTNYDKLIMEVWTDGSVSPEDSIAYSAKILKDQLSIFVNFDEEKTKRPEPEKEQEDFDNNLFKTIDELELPVRASNCLKKVNINYVGELVQKTENDLLKAKNFGRKSLDDILKVLQEMNLELGMKVDNFEEQLEKWLKRNENNEA